MQDPVLNNDEAYRDGPSEANKDMILDRVERWSLTLKKQEAVEEAQNQHITSTPVSTPVDLADDPQLIHRGFLREVDLPGFGKVPFPIGSIGTLLDRPLSPAPSLGQHTAELLTELGYSEPERMALFEHGTI